MPRSADDQRVAAKHRYGRYRLACRALGINHAGSNWSNHLFRLTHEHGEQRLTEAIAAYVERSKAKALEEGRSREGQPGYFGVWCITCEQDCLPIDELDGACGFCGCLPHNGVAVDTEEHKRGRNRAAKSRQRAREREAA